MCMIKIDVDNTEKEQWMKQHRTMMMTTQDFMDQKENYRTHVGISIPPQVDVLILISV